MESTDYTYINNSGTILPNTDDILKEVQAEYRTAFGQDLIVNPDTPQGMLIAAEVLARSIFISNNADVANQINPNLAGGIFLDAIGQLTNFKRTQNTFSQVNVNVTGIEGTVIPTSATAVDTNGNLYQNIAIITLDSGGHGTGLFQAVLPGSIVTPPSALNAIVSGVLGWETITNPAVSTAGSATQSDQSYRKQRNNTLALQGSALPFAIQSALFATDPTTNLSFQENLAATTQVINGITMVAHSIYACISDAGYVSSNGVTPSVSDLDVAKILLSKKSAGAAWNNGGGAGAKSIAVIEPTSGQTYTVLFDRPTLVPILIRVTVSTQTAITNYIPIVQNAILVYAAGQLANEPGFAANQNVSCFELAGAINQQSTGIYIINVETTLASAPTSWSNAPIVIGINEQATIIQSNITVQTA